MDIRGFFAKKGSAPAGTKGAEAVSAKRKAEDRADGDNGPAEVKKPAITDAATFFGASKPVKKAVDPSAFFDMGSTSKSASDESLQPVQANAAKKSNAPKLDEDPPGTISPAQLKHDAKSNTNDRIKRRRDEDVGQATGSSQQDKKASTKHKNDPEGKEGPQSDSVVGGAGMTPLPPPRKWYPGMKDVPPPNKGNKRVPVAASGCLSNQVFVITGTLDSLEREEAQALIEKYGGRVTTGVSGKTSFLLRGTDEHGNPMEGSKAAKARTLGTCKIIDEDGLFDMLRATADQPPETELEPEQPEVQLSGISRPTSELIVGDAPIASSCPVVGTEADHNPPPALWAEKYRPSNVQHLVGNADQVKRLLGWLTSWHRENAEARSSAGAKAAKGQVAFAKAALLSGPPGVGKTSTAKVLLRHLDYDVVELNASDTRSEKALKAMAVDMVGNTSIADFASGKVGGDHRRMALIMDECDGMSAGDRGGMAALLSVIKSSKMPIICICNDRQSQKVKTLANHALDLRFRRPAAAEVKTALRRVVKAEGYHLDDATLDKIAESCNADIRQMLNLLQIWRPASGSPSTPLSAADVSNNLTNAFKDIDVGPFDVSDKFFREPRSAFDTRLRHYFVDSSLTPLLVQENYLTVTAPPPPNMPPKQQHAWSLHRAMLASDYIAIGDVVGARIVKEQQWGLAPLHGALSCIGPGFMMQGNVPRLQFPGWLGRNSTCTKRQRLLRELAGHMQTHISASKEEVRQSYIPALRPPLLRPLLKRGGDGAEEVLEMLDIYDLTKEDFDAITEFELLVGASAKPAIAAVSTAAKSALTRKYNAAHQTMKKVSKSSTSDAGLVRFTDEGLEEEGGDIYDDHDDDKDEENDVQPSKRSNTSKSSAKSKGKARAQ